MQLRLPGTLAILLWTVAFLGCFPAEAQNLSLAPAPSLAPGLPSPVAASLPGTWFTAFTFSPGVVEDLYQTFSGTSSWSSVMVFRDKNGKIMRRTARGSYTLSAVADEAFRLVTTPCDYAPRHTCVVGGACRDWAAITGTSEVIRFKDSSHFQSFDRTTVAERLQHLPIEAAGPVPTVIMENAAGEPVDAMIPVGLDSAPGRMRCAECDDTQQVRICLLGDKGHLVTNSRGCKVCAE